MPSVINPEDVRYVIDNSDGTSTVGIASPFRDAKGNLVEKVTNQSVTRREGNELGKMLEKRQKDQAKIEKAAGGQPPAFRNKPAPLINPMTGRAVTMDEVRKAPRR